MHVYHENNELSASEHMRIITFLGFATHLACSTNLLFDVLHCNSQYDPFYADTFAISRYFTLFILHQY